MDLITVEQLSAIIHKAKASIYSDLIRNPKSLPPVFRITGSRRVLFKDVELWLQGLEQTAPAIAAISDHAPARKRGRPTKTEQLTRAPRVADASPTRGISTQ